MPSARATSGRNGPPSASPSSGLMGSSTSRPARASPGGAERERRGRAPQADAQMIGQRGSRWRSPARGRPGRRDVTGEARAAREEGERRGGDASVAADGQRVGRPAKQRGCLIVLVAKCSTLPRSAWPASTTKRSPLRAARRSDSSEVSRAPSRSVYRRPTAATRRSPNGHLADVLRSRPRHPPDRRSHSDRENIMTKVIAKMSMSLDGRIATPDDDISLLVGVPVFILTHEPPTDWPADSTIRFVTGGLAARRRRGGAGGPGCRPGGSTRLRATRRRSGPPLGQRRGSGRRDASSLQRGRPRLAGPSCMGAAGFEPATSRV
ncbi:MAG: RibD C-terminal domain [Solirubrobacteraceae bacterium]|nr:RibD C-terminal domain [Solirubrobacteraceae bacterium]